MLWMRCTGDQPDGRICSWSSVVVRVRLLNISLCEENILQQPAHLRDQNAVVRDARDSVPNRGHGVRFRVGKALLRTYPDQVTFETLPLVASESTLTRVPYSESETVFPEKITPDTVFPEAIEPIDMPIAVLSRCGLIMAYDVLTVASRTSVVLEDDVGTRVDSDAIVLVLHD